MAHRKSQHAFISTLPVIFFMLAALTLSATGWLLLPATWAALITICLAVYVVLSLVLLRTL